MGTTSLIDSLASVAKSYLLHDRYGFRGLSDQGFEVMTCIPTAVGSTTYQGDEKDFVNRPLEEMVPLKVQFGQTFPLEETVEAHRTMDGNGAGGRLVLLMR